MDTKAICAAVIGARHLRNARNGQDAAASWTGDCSTAAIVVCDGCGSSPSSEVGARLGAKLWIGELGRALAAGGDPSDLAMWTAVRATAVAALGALADALGGERERVVADFLLFTVVAAAVHDGRAGVWAIGDGVYALGGPVPGALRSTESAILASPGGRSIDRAQGQRALGPFADNEPPYVGYELLGTRVEPHFATHSAEAGRAIVATDGAHDSTLDDLVAEPAFTHPDALRRRLVLLARGDERIRWDDRRIVRTPAVLQDDCAVAALRWSAR